MQYESERIEFKEIFVPEIYKEVIAFANTEGGTILVGVDDSGNTVGIQDIDDVYTRITNGIRDAISPDVTMFIKYTLEDRKIIRVEVGEGTYKPYYLKTKGLKPAGVYVRQGASSVPASQEQIRQMIKNTDGDTFEGSRSLDQKLTFRYAEEIFQKRGLEFGEEKFYQLGMKIPDVNLYTNLGKLLSDQCTHTVKAAVFLDENNTVFQDKKEFTGSVFRQLEEAYAYLQLCNHNQVKIEGLEREEHWDYPEAAVREALLNALVHRDYHYSGSILINVNKKETEFISIGGLLPGISQEDIRNGISISRNPKLAEIFYRLRFIEAYGTGIRRIFRLYEDCPRKPRISVTQNSFKITLPNRNTAKEESTAKKEENRKAVKITAQMEKILSYLSENKEIAEEKVQELLQVKSTRAYLIMKQLMEAGFVTVSGRGKNKKYYKL